MPSGGTDSESHTGRGVSPVISVILMVAIALILAAVVGAFALGFGEDNSEPGPAISVELDREGVDSNVAGNEEIIISRGSGENVPMSELRIFTEARCFDDTLLVDGGTKRGELYNLPVDFSGIDNDENVNGDEIFETFGPATEAPLSGNDETWDAGERLRFQIDEDACDVPETGEVTVEILHEPSNSRIAEESLGTGFSPSFGDEFDPATAGDTSTHTWFLNLQAGDYGDPKADDVLGDEVEEITVHYDPNGDGNASQAFNGLNQADITVTMTVSKASANGLVRQEINVNSDSYGGPDATFDLSGNNNKDVEGPIEIEIDGIENPSSAGTYPVEITLDGDAGTQTISKTLEIES